MYNETAMDFILIIYLIMLLLNTSIGNNAGSDVPFAIEARVVGSQLPYNSTKDILTKINPDIGLICFNKYQVDGQCEDYELRYCCHPGE